MNRLKTGAFPSAQAERSGKLSKNGSPTATAPARKKARRLTAWRRWNGNRDKLLPSGAENS
jgi:hypothetical protein